MTGLDNVAGEMMRDFETTLAMIEHGWKLWPATATDEEQSAALARFLAGGQPEWYPAGYVEAPLVFEGKLQPLKQDSEPMSHSQQAQELCRRCGALAAYPTWNDCCARCAAWLRRYTARWLKVN